MDCVGIYCADAFVDDIKELHVRKAARVDANQDQVVSVLRGYGASVQSLAAVGKGVPDLLVGYRGQNFLLEVKDGTKPKSQTKLTDDQGEWHGKWRGSKPIVVYTPTDAVKAILQVGAAEQDVPRHPGADSSAGSTSGVTVDN